MSRPYLSVCSIFRELSNGHDEDIRFKSGVNLIVGEPNTGKTMWLQTLDYVLGGAGENPFESHDEHGLNEKYETAGVELHIGDEQFLVERRWRERGFKSKVIVNDYPLDAQDFQQLLLEKLGIPLLHYPKGNPMSGQTWPELSFRSLFRHIYRRQRFWSGIADKQPPGEQHAAIAHFLGVAERLFSDEYGEMVKLKMQAQSLKERRSQYSHLLNELAREIVSDTLISVDITNETLVRAKQTIESKAEMLNAKRNRLIAQARDNLIKADRHQKVLQLSEQRATLVVGIQELKENLEETRERLKEIKSYYRDIKNEYKRMKRAEDAADVLADLKITHCPACDQQIRDLDNNSAYCFLCKNVVLERPSIKGLGSIRLKFEKDRVIGEEKEAKELIDVLQIKKKELSKEIKLSEERLANVESEMAPERSSVAAFVQSDISEIDRSLGELTEKRREIERVHSAYILGQKINDKIVNLEQKIKELQKINDEKIRSIDFDLAAEKLEKGMNSFLKILNNYKNKAWFHSEVRASLSKNSYTLRVGAYVWEKVLGGTKSLYFLMAYHYGLLALSNHTECNYPGLAIIDIPPDISGEKVKDKENFIVQPFIDLLESGEYDGAQFIITGQSYEGLDSVNRIELNHVYAT